MPRDALPPVHNIVARTERRVQRTLPFRTVFIWGHNCSLDTGGYHVGPFGVDNKTPAQPRTDAKPPGRKVADLGRMIRLWPTKNDCRTLPHVSRGPTPSVPIRSIIGG